jgi:hypothetical protein
VSARWTAGRQEAAAGLRQVGSVRGVASVGGGSCEWEVGGRQAGGGGGVACLIGGELGQEVAEVGRVSRRWAQGRPGQTQGVAREWPGWRRATQVGVGRRAERASLECNQAGWASGGGRSSASCRASSEGNKAGWVQAAAGAG